MGNCLYQEKNISPHYRLEEYRAFLKQTKDTTKQIEIMNAVYAYLKWIAPNMYCPNLGMNATYRSIIEMIPDLEHTMNEEKIFSVQASFPSSVMNESVKLCYEGEIEDKLKSMVQKIRELLFVRLNKEKGSDFQSLSVSDLTGYCSICSAMVEEICKVMHLKAIKVHLEPGFVTHSSLFSGRKKHYCNFVFFENDVYLVDTSYSQFFWLKNNLISRLGVPLLSGCSVGVFMMMTKERRKVAETLLRDGFIKVTPQILKDYLDGFALSYRNGLAYERDSVASYTTDYSAADYLRFLFDADNQINHEAEYTLGIQKRPLSHF